VVEAPDAKAARESARRARIWSPQVAEIGPDEPIVESEVIVYDPHAVRESRSDMLRERPVITIALGVFLGMVMFFICLSIVSCVTGGRAYIG
jgi:hypothetical protein